MRTPEGWHKAWRKNAALFQNAANIIKHAPTPARSSASLRSSPLYVGLRCVASLRRSGLNFLFFTLPGVPRLRRSTAGLFYSAPPGLRIRLACARNFLFNFRFIVQQRLPAFKIGAKNTTTWNKIKHFLRHDDEIGLKIASFCPKKSRILQKNAKFAPISPKKMGIFTK